MNYTWKLLTISLRYLFQFGNWIHNKSTKKSVKKPIVFPGMSFLLNLIEIKGSP